MSIKSLISKSSTVMVNQSQLSSDMGKETIVLDIKSGIYFGLNSVGSSIWELIQQPKTIDEIRDAIVAKYSVNQSQCEEDILALLEELLAEDLIKVKDEVAV